MRLHSAFSDDAWKCIGSIVKKNSSPSSTTSKCQCQCRLFSDNISFHIVYKASSVFSHNVTHPRTVAGLTKNIWHTLVSACVACRHSIGHFDVKHSERVRSCITIWQIWHVLCKESPVPPCAITNSTAGPPAVLFSVSR